MAALMRIFLLFLCVCCLENTVNAGQLVNLNTALLTGNVINPPKTIKDFSLKGTDGKPFTQENLKNHWTLMFFGFTRCGSVCPKSMATLKQIYAKLEKGDDIPKPQVVFVSIDPDRDDLPRIQQYVTSFNPHFIGVTASKPDLKQLTSQLGIFYLYMKSTPAEEKSSVSEIHHSGSILLVDPEGRLMAVFSMPHQADQIVRDYTAITSHYRI